MIVRKWAPQDDLRSLMAEDYASGGTELLLSHPEFDRERAWVAEKEGRVCGFLC